MPRGHGYGHNVQPSEIRQARETLGLSLTGLAEALQMGPNGADRIREWEQGKRPITGPAAVAIKLMVKANRCCEGGPQWGHAWDCPTLP